MGKKWLSIILTVALFAPSRPLFFLKAKSRRSVYFAIALQERNKEKGMEEEEIQKGETKEEVTTELYWPKSAKYPA